MLFGLLSLLMGHWIVYVAKICVRSSMFSTKFYPCAVEQGTNSPTKRIFWSTSHHSNMTNSQDHYYFCPEVVFVQYIYIFMNIFLSGSILKRSILINCCLFCFSRVINHLFLIRVLSSYIVSCLFLGSLMFPIASLLLPWP